MQNTLLDLPYDLQLRIYHNLSPYDQLSLIESTIFPRITLQAHLEESLWRYGIVWKELQAFLEQINGCIVGWFPIWLMVPRKNAQWGSCPNVIHISTTKSIDKVRKMPYLVLHEKRSRYFTAFLQLCGYGLPSGIHCSMDWLCKAFSCSITHRQIQCQYYDLTDKGTVRWPIYDYLFGKTDIKAMGWFHLRQRFAKYYAQELLTFPEWNGIDRLVYLCGYTPPIKEYIVELPVEPNND